MSKQSEAKKNQNYNPKPIKPECQNCYYFTSDKVLTANWIGTKYYSDKNLRCGIGGFAVKKTATCDLYQQITEVKSEEENK